MLEGRLAVSVLDPFSKEVSLKRAGSKVHRWRHLLLLKLFAGPGQREHVDSILSFEEGFVKAE